MACGEDWGLSSQHRRVPHLPYCGRVIAGVSSTSRGWAQITISLLAIESGTESSLEEDASLRMRAASLSAHPAAAARVSCTLVRRQPHGPCGAQRPAHVWFRWGLLRWRIVAERSSDKTSASAQSSPWFALETVARSYFGWVAECLPKACHPSQQAPTEPTKRRGLTQLLRDPGVGRVARHARMDHPARGQLDHEEGRQRPEEKVGDGQEVARPDSCPMVAQESSPGLAGSSRRPHAAYVLLDGRPGHMDVQLQEFPADALDAPQAVDRGHRTDQRDCVRRDGGAMRRCCGTGLLTPETAKELAMPPEQGVGLDDEQGLAPGAEAAKRLGGVCSQVWHGPVEAAELCGRGHRQPPV